MRLKLSRQIFFRVYCEWLPARGFRSGFAIRMMLATFQFALQLSHSFIEGDP